MRTSVRFSRRVAISAAVIAAAGTAGAVALAGYAHATTPSRHHKHSASCGAATLRGTYLFQGNGWSVSGGTGKPVAFAGSERFDGAGHIRGNSTSSSNGVITRSRAFTGTYTVAANCTGTFTIGTTLRFDLYASPDGSTFTYIETNPGSVSSATEQRATLG